MSFHPTPARLQAHCFQSPLSARWGSIVSVQQRYLNAGYHKVSSLFQLTFKNKTPTAAEIHTARCVPSISAMEAPSLQDSATQLPNVLALLRRRRDDDEADDDDDNERQQQGEIDQLRFASNSPSSRVVPDNKAPLVLS